MSGQRRVAGRYLLIEQIGQGGMGVVWRAHDELLDRVVAVKEVRYAGVDDEKRASLNQRTMREARAAGRLDHPSVVVIHDVIEEDGRPWIVMQLVRSRSLGTVVRTQGPLAPHYAASVGLQVLGALRAAHAAGVLHRDVKPENVLLADDGRVVLTDFGIATTEEDPALTSTGAVIGTPAFLPPERLNGLPATAESDLWSLGATLYAAVEGRSPFDRGATAPTMAAVLYDEPTPMARAGLLAPVITGLLAKDPDTRMRAEEAAELLRGTSERHVPPPAARTAERPVRPAARRGRTALLAAAVAVPLALASAGAAVWLALRGGETAEPPPGSTHVAIATASQAQRTSPSPPTTPRPAPSPSSSRTAQAPATGRVAVPPRWKPYRHPTMGYSLAIPPGWSATDHSTRSRTEIRSARGTSYLWVEWTTPEDPTGDPVRAMAELERRVLAEKSLPGYRRIAIRPLTYLGRPAADWEFTFTTTSEGTVHVIDRGFQTESGQHYVMYWRTPETEWHRNLHYFKAFARTFRP
ncbi:Serine/threonine protein kinase [Sinosporangium album]|uniref:non-specific serine/threonine protein kinase n=1 Tax=Sinosporangium album TaxID=504805 RepID=A0A1G7XAT1_9ACTN|nr:serine/threonine-protein kinase [Sinosporangium album]SDG81332.1 Serine/threonine protein kinase [Sinosporangium album]